MGGQVNYTEICNLSIDFYCVSSRDDTIMFDIELVKDDKRSHITFVRLAIIFG